MAQPLVDLSNIGTIEVVDGFGRTHRSFQVKHVRATLCQDGTTLRIAHDGDTSYGSAPRDDERYDNRIAGCQCLPATAPDTI